jgi:RHS repeat-associated protein
VAQKQAYYPWGDTWLTAGSGTFDNRFAGMQDRDAYTGLDPTQFRSYESRLGRWLSPDPLGGDLTNPQSLNRYSYVLNNPATLTDPSGLCTPGDDCAHPRFNDAVDMEVGCGPAFGPCNYVDGFPVSQRVAAGLFGMGSSAYCPGGVCEGFGTDPYTGQTAFLQFAASASGASGYLSVYDWTQGVNDVNGAFMSNTAYQAYLRGNFLDAINAQLNAVIAALEAKGVKEGAITNFVNYLNNNFTQIFVEGGNANFPATGKGFNFGGFNCPNGRCGLGSNGTLDFSHPGGSFHLDTANPYNFPGGTLLHLGVDLILGNTAYYVIPRN